MRACSSAIRIYQPTSSAESLYMGVTISLIIVPRGCHHYAESSRCDGTLTSNFSELSRSLEQSEMSKPDASVYFKTNKISTLRFTENTISFTMFMFSVN